MSRIVDDVLAIFGSDDIEVEDARQACLVLSQLLVGQPIPASLWTEKKRQEMAYVWLQVVPRSVNPGDRVRVKKDAYTAGTTMAWHNGREGVVVAIRRGIVVSYSGQVGLGTTHALAALERRVPVPHLASQAKR